MHLSEVQLLTFVTRFPLLSIPVSCLITVKKNVKKVDFLKEIYFFVASDMVLTTCSFMGPDCARIKLFSERKLS